jgi:hypothetical protein
MTNCAALLGTRSGTTAGRPWTSLELPGDISTPIASSGSVSFAHRTLLARIVIAVIAIEQLANG